MVLIDLASANSLWKGVDYFEDKKVSLINKLDVNIYESEVLGSRNHKYHVRIDKAHPRKSKCTCPFADGRRVICKHMVATYFTIHPEEAKRVIDEANEYEKEEESYQQELYNDIVKYVNSLTKQELRAQLISHMIDDSECRNW